MPMGRIQAWSPRKLAAFLKKRRACKQTALPPLPSGCSVEREHWHYPHPGRLPSDGIRALASEECRRRGNESHFCPKRAETRHLVSYKVRGGGIGGQTAALLARRRLLATDLPLTRARNLLLAAGFTSTMAAG